ncbi:hypothetical protein NIES4071_109590 (plasmid) [Calothrix sp. NIES-4071]|nr:hypothetical protein NIES4071_109590 [Calothrix sp. NIES-4071]BAZ65233.1 hypothetical protein NIES4105_109660 [Calothrix sp. NIES-4105]
MYNPTNLLLSIEDATWIGLKLKSIIRLLKKAPAGGTYLQLQKEFPGVGDNLEAILELAIALELIEDDYDGDVRIYKLSR